MVQGGENDGRSAGARKKDVDNNIVGMSLREELFSLDEHAFPLPFPPPYFFLIVSKGIRIKR